MTIFKIWDPNDGETNAVDVEGKNAEAAALAHGIELLDSCGSDYVDLEVRIGGLVRGFRVSVKTEYEIDER